jgi:hypothetical protein
MDITKVIDKYLNEDISENINMNDNILDSITFQNLIEYVQSDFYNPDKKFDEKTIIKLYREMRDNNRRYAIRKLKKNMKHILDKINVNKRSHLRVIK